MTRSHDTEENMMAVTIYSHMEPFNTLYWPLTLSTHLFIRNLTGKFELSCIALAWPRMYFYFLIGGKLLHNIVLVWGCTSNQLPTPIVTLFIHPRRPHTKPFWTLQNNLTWPNSSICVSSSSFLRD